VRRRRLPRLSIAGLRLGPLVSIYAWRIRRHGVQELLAGMGIAVGVALMFGVLVASESITGSAGQALHAITGSARLQLSARSPDGFDERLAIRAGQLPGVRVAAPVLRGDAVLAGSKGRQAIQLVGVTPSQVALNGAATRSLGAGAGLLAGGIGVSSSAADRTGARSGQTVTLFVRGAARRLPVRVALGQEALGPVADSPLAVALLPLAQRALNEPKRVTEVLIEPRAGAQRQVERELRRLGGARVDVQPADHELAVLKATAQPTNQSSKLFAAIGAIVGFLLALNAMLLTVPERRRWIAELRTQGFSAGQVGLILGFQAGVLGTVASLAGVLLGDVLARTLFGSVPSYLTLAFPIGTHPVIPIGTVALALACGVLATLGASLAPMRDLLPTRAIDSVLHGSGKIGQGIGAGVLLASAVLGVAILVAVTVAVLLAPGLSILGGILLGLAVLCFVPCLLVLVVRALTPLSERVRGSMLAIGLIELEGTATRSIALAGVAALAIFGSVAVQGARDDLVAGLDKAVVQYLDTADIWVTATGDNFLTVDSFSDEGAKRRIAQLAQVASVRDYQGALLDAGTRRLWIRARPSGDRTMIQASQMLQGSLSRATRLLRAGGWAVLSSGLAHERHVSLGGAFALPTPGGAMPLRVAAITTNTGWPPGAITINASDYRRWWQTPNATALEVNLRPGVSIAAGTRAISAALDSRSGLLVQSRAEREAQYKQSARQGVRSLSEISTLILIASALAIAFALSATISARRPDLAARKTEGYGGIQLWRSLLAESTAVLSIGALDGALCGIYGHALASRWLRLSQGFPAPFSVGLAEVFLTLAFISAVSLIVIALFGASASKVAPQVTMQE